ncbi:MAG: RNA polymerase sigma factor [Cyclobacteriaceae bacterium]|jgi:RNA polymerase sigma-70 factor (ECF subfamily)|nr:RNA polymerase sigma factor [Cyclobacteriaceae bacterium]
MDLEAFQTSVLPLKSKLFRFALRILGNADEAKDVVQEVFTRVWAKGKAMEEVRNWEAWCMRVVHNLAIDRIRLNHRQHTVPLSDGLHIRHDTLSPHDRTELVESMRQVAEIMTTLPPKQQQVIHLRDVEGYSYKEICEVLDLDMSQVKVYLFRARNALREKLSRMNAYGLKGN